MALHEDVRPLLAARAASDPAAAKLLEMFARADEDLRQLSQNGPSLSESRYYLTDMRSDSVAGATGVRRLKSVGLGLVVQDNVQQRAVDLRASDTESICSNFLRRPPTHGKTSGRKQLTDLLHPGLTSLPPEN